METGDAATWFALGVAIISSFIALGSMNAAKRSAGAAERQAGSAKRSADAAEIQAESAKRSADLAERQADTADSVAKATQDQIDIMKQQVQNEVNRMNREDRPEFTLKSRIFKSGAWAITVKMIKGNGPIRVHPVWMIEAALLTEDPPIGHEADLVGGLNVIEGQLQQVVLDEEFDIFIPTLYQAERGMTVQVHLHCVEVGGLQRSWMWLKAIKLPGPFRFRYLDSGN
ncbi:hypothetical protein ACTG9Q_06345 [Actinokineospora sp. 24-640]